MINKLGRVGKETVAAVKAWKRTQKPNHEGYYECHYCLKWVTYLMAEHMESKTRSPSLRIVHDNFVPVCAPCNKEKGSKSHDEFCVQCIA